MEVQYEPIYLMVHSPWEICEICNKIGVYVDVHLIELHLNATLNSVPTAGVEFCKVLVTFYAE